MKTVDLSTMPGAQPAPAPEALALPLAWAEMTTQAIDTWLQWQGSLWQPCIDLQVAWLTYLAQMGGWAPLDIMRGAEQLA